MTESEPMNGSEYVLPEMTTEEHLAELRRRLLVSLAAVAGGSVVGWFVAPALLRTFVADVGRPFVFVSPAEAFATQLKLAVFVGTGLALPVILVQAWLFVLPALFPHERRAARRYMLPSVALFVLGVAFAYFVVYPLALRFLLGFGSDRVQPYISIAPFLAFFIRATLPFGLVFQFPVVLVVLVRLEMVSVRRLAQLRGIIYFLSFIVSAVLTPPDVASQALMAVPVILLYEVTLRRLRKEVVAGDD